MPAAAMWGKRELSAAGATDPRAELARAHDKRVRADRPRRRGELLTPAQAHARAPRARAARRTPWAPPPFGSWAEGPEDDEMDRPAGLGVPPGLQPRTGGAQAAVAAVAAGGGAEPAVAATRAELDALRLTQPFDKNNIALKWLRDTSEDPPGFPIRRCVDITAQDPMDIGVLHMRTGMAYSFREGATQPWSWRQMLAGLKSDVKDKVLGTDPSVGVVRITCEATDAYDHKRWHAARDPAVGRPFAEGAPVPLWDFHVYRTDNVVVRFHTSLTTTKVEVATVGSGLVLPGPPMAGKGNSDGRGTYKYQTTGNYEASYRGTAFGEPAAAAEGSAVAEVGLQWQFAVADRNGLQFIAPPWAPDAGSTRQPSDAAAGEEAQRSNTWSGEDWWSSGWARTQEAQWSWREQQEDERDEERARGAVAGSTQPSTGWDDCAAPGWWWP